MPTDRTTRKLRKMGAVFGKRGGAVPDGAWDSPAMAAWHESHKLAVLLDTNHEATETAVLASGRVFARGCLYHTNGDHARRKMGDGRTWHEIHRNTVPRSFSAPRAWTIRGSVD